MALHSRYLLEKIRSIQARGQWQWKWRVGDRFDIYLDARINRTWGRVCQVSGLNTPGGRVTELR